MPFRFKVTLLLVASRVSGKVTLYAIVMPCMLLKQKENIISGEVGIYIYTTIYPKHEHWIGNNHISKVCATLCYACKSKCGGKSNEFEVARAIWLMQKPKKRNLWFCCWPTYATFSRSITFSFILLLSSTASWRYSPRPANIAGYKCIRIDRKVVGDSKIQKYFNRVISLYRSNHKGI